MAEITAVSVLKTLKKEETTASRCQHSHVDFVNAEKASISEDWQEGDITGGIELEDKFFACKP